MTNTFHKDYPEKSIAMLFLKNLAQPIAKPIVKLLAKRLKAHMVIKPYNLFNFSTIFNFFTNLPLTTNIK